MKRIVICYDGTWNAVTDPDAVTNVVRLGQAVRKVSKKDGKPQMVYYNAGVGSGGPVDRFLGGVFGVGLHRRGPSSRWRSFLRQHGSEIWACDFFCVRTITFRTLYVFFVIDHTSRQVLHVEVTPNPTASWAAQQMVECCAWDRKPPRFLVRDRDSCYGATFDRRVRNIGIAQVRTPFRSPRA